MAFRMRYRGRTGARFQLLFIDPVRLMREAVRCGWRCQVLYEEAQGRYLARLTPDRAAAMRRGNSRRASPGRRDSATRRGRR
jgi:hypothetical protein